MTVVKTSTLVVKMSLGLEIVPAIWKTGNVCIDTTRNPWNSLENFFIDSFRYSSYNSFRISSKDLLKTFSRATIRKVCTNFFKNFSKDSFCNSLWDSKTHFPGYIQKIFQGFLSQVFLRFFFSKCVSVIHSTNFSRDFFLEISPKRGCSIWFLIDSSGILPWNSS